MRLVTTLLADSAAALARQAKGLDTDWVEVRLDAVPGLTPVEVPALRRAVPRRAIATCRAGSDGGRFLGTEVEREALLRAAVGAGFDAVDLEAGTRPFRALADEATRAGVELLVSRHHLGPAALDAEVEAFLDAVPLHALAKYAAKVEGAEDLAALVRACGLARERGLRYAVMGLGNSSLRLLAPLLGCELVYCAAPEGPAGAAGQVPAALVRQVHASLPPRGGITGRHRLVVLLGDPVEGSLSPAMQNAAFAAGGDELVYAAVKATEASLGKVLAGLREAGLAGANVTVPLKEAVLGKLDRVAPEARAARSVNTLVVKGSRLAGHTTDGAGALAALREAGAEPAGALALVLGAGGTGRAVAHALARAGAEVLVANRSPARGRALARAVGGAAVPWKPAALREAAHRAAIVLHCTTLGRDGKGCPLPAGAVHEKHVVLDAVYRPGGTPLVRLARNRGAVALPGEALLLHQGALAYTLWTGKPAPLGPMRAALLESPGASA